MEKKLSIMALTFSLLVLTACGNTSKNENSQNITLQKTTQEISKTSEKTEKSLNDLILVFGDLMDQYLKDNKKSLKNLEKMHLSFVPILNFSKFKGDENYKISALSVGSIVHRLEDLEGTEYQELLSNLKPAYIKFYAEYGG